MTFDALLDMLGYDESEPLLFNSGFFLAVFTVFLIGYSYMYKMRNARTWYIVLFSLYFYYKSSGLYLSVLWTTIILDYFLAKAMHQSRNPGERKLFLLLSLLSSLGLLAFFKYTNFFIENINGLSGTEMPELDIFLPIGISFYTFQSISYVVDIYKREIPPARNFIDYAFYMSFFPHLVAGPIVRARYFLPQLEHPPVLEARPMFEGLYFILRGLIKKAIIANYIAQFNDVVFENPGGYSGLENLLAVYGYTLQIYCDFSGYSDMAMGIARLMGYDLGVNFNSPYHARNITDFWRRWHISLSSWLRDYVYIPMGGNRKGEERQLLHLLATMLIGGLWHGPSWNFVLWGALHGIGLVVHKLIMSISGKQQQPTPLALQILFSLLTFHFVAALWVFFRAEDLEKAIGVFGAILFNFNAEVLSYFFEARKLWLLVLAIGYFIILVPPAWKDKLRDAFIQMPLVAKALVFLLVVQLVIQLQGEGVQPFIYFQF